MANVTVFDTPKGLLLIDSGSYFLTQKIFQLVRSWSKKPLYGVVWTHGHGDHAGSIRLFEEENQRLGSPAPIIYAHENVSQRFERYRETAGWNSCINSRQFSVKTKWPTDYRHPDVTYTNEMILQLDGQTVEIFHGKGETDDASWVFCPKNKVLCTGDFIIWAFPNCGNPQKVQRFAKQWAATLRKMEAKKAHILFPGHGHPVIGADRVSKMLTETAFVLELIHTKTVELMNEGMGIYDILERVKVPQQYLERPYLTPIYDEPEFCVRNVWRLYGGWWDFVPSNLKPAPPSQLAAQISNLAGGADGLAAAALMSAQEGNLRVACHLVDFAFQTDPTSETVLKARIAIYNKRVQEEKSLMSRGIFGAVIKEAKEKLDALKDPKSKL